MNTKAYNFFYFDPEGYCDQWKFFIKPSGYYIYHLLYHSKTRVLPTGCICVFRVIITINDCFPEQHETGWGL
jgi:hypothetical protein